MAGSWYALRSKPRKEEVVWRQVLSRGVETFFPQIRVNPVNPRARKLRPYFPGYLFVFADLEEVGLSVFKWMPFTVGLVSFGGEPAIVPPNLIFSIRERVEEINTAGGEIFERLQQGEEVRIREGPFKGYEAIFDARVPGSVRVRVLLKLLDNQRQVPLEMDASHIQRKK